VRFILYKKLHFHFKLTYFLKMEKQSKKELKDHVDMKLMPLSEKINNCQTLKRQFSKNKLFLDENSDNFGMSEFSQLTKVKNTSEVKGYPFKGRMKNIKIPLGIKVVPNETKYDKTQHPSYLEFMALKLLTEELVDKNVTPHIVYYLGQQKISNRSRAIKFLNLKKLEVEEKIRSNNHILISEYVSGGSLDNWIYTLYEDDKKINDLQWKCITFQLLYTIHVLQKKYKMMHNDFHYGNILIDTSIKPGGYFVYKFNNQTYYIPNFGFIPKLWDFEFAMIYHKTEKTKNFYANKFVYGATKIDPVSYTVLEDLDPEDIYNVPMEYNEVYDVHYFLTSLLDLYISQDLFDWVLSLYPKELIPPDSDTDSTTTSPKNTNFSQTDKSHLTFSTDDTDYTQSLKSQEKDTEDNDTTSVDWSSDTSSTYEKELLYDGRLINGVEKNYPSLPVPLQLLQSPFFNIFTQKPKDFNVNECIVFELH
jgi:hypothetical protein